MSASVSQQQQQQKQPAAVTTAEEEALKRNTDCVYFLASPLTCKKGSECEYRHSEYARVNPRDCYFWLNGNCLNPKCGFRHPPLDGLLGNQGVASAGSSAHPSHAVPGPASSAAHSHHSVGKQGVPCVFFQKGMCVKGDRCAFLHIPNPAANKTHQPADTTPATEPQPFKKPLGGLGKCSEGKKFPSANFSKAAKAHVDAGAAPKVQDTGLGDVRAIERYVPQPVGYEPVPQKNAVGVPLFTEVGHSTPLLQTHGPDDNNSFHNGKDADDVLRESSPGFDVLVDSELRDSEYYHGEDQFGRRSQEGRNFVNEYDPDFHAIADAEEEVFHDPRGYDSYGHMRAWGQRRTSSERGEHLERRAYSKDERPDCINESDLRYRLSKHKRVNGLRSVVSHEYAPNYSEEQSFMDTCRDTLQESSISSRLQGRIKLPGRVNGTDTHFERGTQGRQIRSQLSADRHQIPHQGRLRDRIKGRLEDNYGDQDRSFRAPWTRRREMVDERNSQFPAPKSLAELKSEKEESKAQPSLRKRKSLEDYHHPHSQQPEDTFEAPLPLSEILKRKRAAAASTVSGNKDGMPRETKEKENAVAAVSKEENREASKFVAEDKTELGHDELSEPKQILEAETEGMTMEEGAEDDQVYEGDDQNGEYYYYEEGYEEDGEYIYEEGEEEEYVGEEEGEGGDGSRGGDGGENGSAAKIDVMLT